MKDLRKDIDLEDGLFTPLNKETVKQNKVSIILQEYMFILTKNKYSITKYLIIFIMLLLFIKYPSEIGYGIGYWIKEFTNSFTTQIDLIR